ncbi:MAG: hypothetical protein C0404_01140 [Verrucomicrobia bacterium]|nr:hypothetical protein [Verrucomicrobiota bacterium]
MLPEWMQRVLWAGAALFATMYALAGYMQGDMKPFLALFAVGAVILMTINANYPLYLAFIIVCPFNYYFFPYQLTTFTIILGISIFAAGLRWVVGHDRERGIAGFDWAVLGFFALVTARYLSSPVLPQQMSGVSNVITGFRVWFDYGIALTTVLFLGFMLRDETAICRFLRWTLIFSIAMALVFLVLIPIKEPIVTLYLRIFGIHIDLFDNGWRRFVVLPQFGFTMLLAAMLPKVFMAERFPRKVIAVLGLVCVAIGANRSSFLAIAVSVVVLLLIKRQFKYVFLTLASLAACIIGFIIAFESGLVSANTPGIRVAAMFNQSIDRESGAAGNMEWRARRWKAAWDDIKKRPFAGSGYGGLEHLNEDKAYRQSTDNADLVDISLATGGIHNGYLSGARGVGIPAIGFVLLFLFIRSSTMLKLSMRNSDVTALPFQMTGYGLAMVIYLALNMLTGLDVHSPQLWMNLAAVLIMEKLIKKNESSAARSPDRSNTADRMPGP